MELPQWVGQPDNPPKGYLDAASLLSAHETNRSAQKKSIDFSSNVSSERRKRVFWGLRRRSFLQASVVGAAALRAQQPKVPARKKLAAIVTDYRIHSDADAIVTRFLEGFWINDDFERAGCDIASLYVKRVQDTDVATRVSAAYRVPIMGSTSEALMLGAGQLAVDGVLLVGEDYGASVVESDSRFEFFSQIVSVFKKTGRSVPIFCCGYLSTNWDHARQMVEQSRKIGFLLMAGSAEAVTFRRPELEYPLPSGFEDAPLGDRAHHDYKLGVEFDDALVIAPGGPQNIFSSFEILQSFLERRLGGETGIGSIEYLAGNAVWQAADQWRWSKDLMDAALGRAERPGNEHPELWLIQYTDGTQGALLSLGNLVRDPLAAFRVKGRREIDTTLCYAPVESRNHFSPLVRGIAEMMTSGNPPYPIERNLLTTGALSFLRAAAVEGKRIDTPALQISYTAPEHSFFAHGRGW